MLRLSDIASLRGGCEKLTNQSCKNAHKMPRPSFSALKGRGKWRLGAMGINNVVCKTEILRLEKKQHKYTNYKLSR